VKLGSRFYPQDTLPDSHSMWQGKEELLVTRIAQNPNENCSSRPVQWLKTHAAVI